MTDSLIQDARALNDVADELKRARAKFSRFASAHEGHSVIMEEFIELQEEVFLKQELRDRNRMRKEAIQVAAMALRFASDVTPATDL